MQRISIKESKQFFPAKDVSNASYFTLSPSPRGEGWESVTYFTNRKKTFLIPIVMAIMILGFMFYLILFNRVF